MHGFSTREPRYIAVWLRVLLATSFGGAAVWQVEEGRPWMAAFWGVLSILNLLLLVHAWRTSSHAAHDP